VILIYYINNNNIDIDKKYIASICGVSEVTITKSVKQFMKYDKAIKEYINNLS